MFVNKIGNNFNPGFKGYRQERNDAGDFILRFNHPASTTGDCYIEFFNVKKDDYSYSGYSVIEEPVGERIKIERTGTVVNPKDIKGLKPGEPFAYRIVSNGKTTPDSGIQLAFNYNLVTPRTSSPVVHGTGYFAMPDSLMPGVFYRPFNDEKTGEIYKDGDYQKRMENTVRTFSNEFGGNLAGMEEMIPKLKKAGYKYFFTTPTGGGDNVSSHHYWTDNNKQVPISLGNIDNYSSFIRNMYRNGLVHVFDATFTSEGLSGTHFQYALRWADKNPQTFYWFKMTGLKDAPLGLGTIPKNKENLRHRVINAPYIYDEAKNKVVKNPAYDSGKETLFQIYDASQVTDEQLEILDGPIKNYKNIKAGNFLECNNHDDTLVNYIFQVDPDEYKHQLEELQEFNKGRQNPIKQNTPEGTIFVSQFSNFKINTKTEGGFVAWDANTDMVKKNFQISGYDEKLDMAIVDKAQREIEKQKRERGAIEVQDLAIKDAVYWAQKYKDEQVLYTAQTLKGADTTEKLTELSHAELLPKEAVLNQNAINNVLNGWYHYDTKAKTLDKDDITIKSLMKLPLDSLELAQNTVGVLSTSFFTDLASEKEQIGKSRFELMQEENPHLTAPYTHNYLKVNDLFINEVKNFADEIIKKLNEKSTEKLLDENGEYTQYGENIIEFFGQSIAKYAFLKAIRGENLEAKVLPNGELTYDYDDIRENTTLEKLGIKEYTPETEASALENLIEKGLRKLNAEDVDFVTESISRRTEGTTSKDFALAKAMVEKAGLGIAFRLDACKDIMDMDAVRNGETDFEDVWDKLIDYWRTWVQEVKKVNPNAYVVAEITDVEQLMKSVLGEDTAVYDTQLNSKKYPNVKEAILRFFLETGVTSEAGYSYFFTDMLRAFSADFENAEHGDAASKLKEKFKELTTQRSIDYVRNLYTFAGNHDKPRLLHGLSLNMELFHGKNLLNSPDKKATIMQILTNSDSLTEMPLEAALNIDNNEYFDSRIPFSTKSIAMSKKIRDNLSVLDENIASKEEIDLLKEATRDLANGNFLGKGDNLSMTTINIPELSSLENAARAILELAKQNHGLEISDEQKEDLISKMVQYANQENRLTHYAVKGNFDDDNNRARLNAIFTDKDKNYPQVNHQEYNLYTTNLTALLREAFFNCGYSFDEKLEDAFRAAQIDFINKYNQKTVEESRKIPFIDNYKTAIRRDAFGTRDIKTALEMVIEQANYLAREQGRDEIRNKDEILFQLYRSITEPAIDKACAYMAFLSGLTGISTMYAGDELGMSGYDEKAKNVYLQNRNALPWSLVKEEAPKEIKTLEDYITSIESRMNEAMNLRNRPGAEAISNGTLYEIDTSNKDIVGALIQNEDGEFAITLLNTQGIGKGDGVRSTQDQGIDYIKLVGLAAVPVGYVFANTASRDTAEYVVQKQGEDIVIKNKNGHHIAFNDTTAPNRVMVLAPKMSVEEAQKVQKKEAEAIKQAKEALRNKPAEEPKKPITRKKTSSSNSAGEKVKESVKKGNKKAWGIAAGVAAVATAGYLIYKKNKNSKKKNSGLNVVG